MIKMKNPDEIINIVDATNLSRSLFFTTQLLELGIPVVVALNKSDITDKNEIEKADRKRFESVNKIVSQVETRKVLTKTRNTQDKIDAVLANKWLGIPIFAVVMWLVFDISQSKLGPFLADILVGWIETFQGYVAEMVSGASPFLQAAVVMWLVFDISQSKLGPFLADILVGWIETFQGYVAEMVSGASPFLQALLVDGIIGGVGAVVGFLPLVMVMYFLIALLEDCGYMARVSVVMDPIFKRVGLSGKSIIPLLWIQYLKELVFQENL